VFLSNFFYVTVEKPVMRHVRRVMPDLGPLDISPIIVFLGLQLLTYMIVGSIR
jgi:YggT family protein